jgi:ribosomal protein S19
MTPTRALMLTTSPVVNSTVIPMQVEIKPDMIGGYLAEYSISYKPVKHGKPGIGATHSSRFIPLK